MHSDNELSLEISKMNFSYKLKKSSQAIQNPYMPPLKNQQSDNVSRM